MVSIRIDFILIFINWKGGDSNFETFLVYACLKISVRNRIDKFDQTHVVYKKSSSFSWTKRNTTIFLVETATFFIQKHIILVSNRFCLQKKQYGRIAHGYTVPLPIPSYIIHGQSRPRVGLLSKLMSKISNDIGG